MRPRPLAMAATRLLPLMLLLAACAEIGPPPVAVTAATAAAPAAIEPPPPEPREFRAAWVATVANIDWPSRPGLAPDVQRAEALALLDRAAAIGLNALILQVRPAGAGFAAHADLLAAAATSAGAEVVFYQTWARRAGDAFYASTLEPWSEYLTGAQGRAPVPAWDPLAWWVGQAQARGLELHVWFNPFRARHSAAKSPLAAPHLGVRQPSAVRRYGEQLWMDPGEPAAAAHTLAVVADVVRRYDIDGVHIDDYFYPYPSPTTRPTRGTDKAAARCRATTGAAPTSMPWCRNCTPPCGASSPGCASASAPSAWVGPTAALRA